MMRETPAKIILSPKVQSLWRECETLRDEVVRLPAEAHELVQVVKPNLIALYQTRLGDWELKRLRRRCDIAGLKRKITLIQADINRGEAVDESKLEGQLDLELLDWRTRVAEAVAALDEAKIRLDHTMADEEAKELRNIYRALVKKLHPDLHADLNDQERQLWHRVQQAYDRADLEELRALAMIQPSSIAAARPNTIEQLVMERDLLKGHVTRLLAEIAARESQPPFTLRKKLGGADWLKVTRQMIDTEGVELEAQCADLETHVHKILAAAQNGNGFSRN